MSHSGDPTHAVTTDITLLEQARAVVGAEPPEVVDVIVLPDQPWDLREQGLVLSCALTDERSRAAALQAAARGVRLAVAVEAATVDRFVADLRAAGDEVVVLIDGEERRAGDVPASDSRASDSSATDPVAALSQEQRSLLALLAEGWTVPDAARQLYLSLRTAERRLSAARRALGVSTTAEAVALVGRPRD